MIRLIVDVDVRPEFVDAFIKETIQARDITKLMEPGCIQYEINQNILEPTQFTLIETYLDNDAIELHKTTKHFLDWRENVQKMMAKPRSATRNKII